ncbi:hypothetical protein [Candidatus Wolbachia massiliensis]|uniref:Uncharacterized protein n=1 Tax=Candidatus Wolbachia massiliensis TaxID=1845000 RepID=A0A7L7YM98_9RICK|nr:hypothetical protein [Candidatus Wolbachia massiliensis]QOD38343.1 hypothetical protein ID128_00160 [Candidatus Wolbachia massiliensis]
MNSNKDVETLMGNKNSKLSKGLHSRSVTSLLNEKDKFIQAVVGTVKADALREFLNTDKGQNMFDVIYENKVRRNMSSILCGTGAKAKDAFQGLYDLLFDDKGNKTKYLKTLEEKSIDLARISSILNGAGAKAKDTFQGLYDLWFDDKGNKTKYLRTLEKEGIDLASISSILNGAGAKAKDAFQGLYDLWFDNGNKTKYLRTLEKEGIDLASISSILNGAGAKANTNLHK